MYPPTSHRKEEADKEAEKSHVLDLLLSKAHGRPRADSSGSRESSPRETLPLSEILIERLGDRSLPD